MNNVVSINEVQQPATLPFTEEQQCDIAYELEERISQAFEGLDINVYDLKTRTFFEWLEWQCKKWVDGGLDDAVELFAAVTKSFEPKDPGKERRIRRQLAKDGYTLRKSRVRNPDASTYGLYWIIDLALNIPAAHGGGADGGMTLFEVEEWVNTPAQAAH